MAEEGKVNMNLDEYKKLIKKYKKTKKYMKSNLFQIKMMDGTEKFVTNLMKEAEQIENEL
tara:strand:- start:482 stop:661 length:180 start_codon:yes stop_codon:yes gene_type:complete